MILSSFLVFLVKGILISGILFGYYCLVLRNTRFHLYNRWYLLGSVMLSLLIPFLQIPLPAIWTHTVSYATVRIGLTPDFATPVKSPDPGQAHPGFWQSLQRGSKPFEFVYLSISCFLGIRLLYSLFVLRRLSRRQAHVKKDRIWFYTTREPGAPFSFFRRLYWHEDIRLDSEKGQSVLRHELYHIRHGHSADVLALETIRCVFWCNPFLSLILRELRLVHEFLADRHAWMPADEPRAVYAEWLVWQSIRERRPSSLTHSFYHTHLKRRISMIMQPRSGRGGYLRLAIALPLALLLCGAFTGSSSRPSGPVPAKFDPVQKMTTGNQLLRFYIRHLRYPEAAVRQGEEQTVWFSIKIGAGNQLLEFSEHKTRPGDLSNEITVTAYADDKTIIHPTGPASERVFVDEVESVSRKLSADTGNVYPPGEYSFVVQFKLEKHQ